MHFKAHFQEAYLYRGGVQKNCGSGRIQEHKKIKRREIEDAFIKFSSETAARDSAFTDLITTNGNLPRTLRQKEEHIRVLQAEMCNLNVVAAAQTTDIGGDRNVGGNSNTHKKNQ